MRESAIRTAAVLAALVIFIGLATPVASEAGPVRNRTAGAEAEQAAVHGGPWQSLADLWQWLLASVTGATEDEDRDGEGGEEVSGSGAPDGGNSNGGNENGGSQHEGDTGPGTDPNG